MITQTPCYICNDTPTAMLPMFGDLLPLCCECDIFADADNA